MSDTGASFTGELVSPPKSPLGVPPVGYIVKLLPTGTPPTVALTTAVVTGLADVAKELLCNSPALLSRYSSRSASAASSNP